MMKIYCLLKHVVATGLLMVNDGAYLIVYVKFLIKLSFCYYRIVGKMYGYRESGYDTALL
jgi:hypothetical protein